jgi:beta-glucanase (GH16 family)
MSNDSNWMAPSILVSSLHGLLTGAAPLVPMLNRDKLRLTFSDEFTSFNPATWQTKFSFGRTLASNKELELYVDAPFTAAWPKPYNPFSISGHVLNITAIPTPAVDAVVAVDPQEPTLAPFKYLSGVITSHSGFSQLYGVFEIRCKLPGGQGLWPAFWLDPQNNTWPPEIDVMEFIGSSDSSLFTTVHSASQTFSTGHQVARMTADFHVYTVDWQADFITWYMDDIQVYRVATPAEVNTPMFLIANLAVGGAWPGPPDPTNAAFPAVMQIDWIRAWAR